MFVDTKSRSNHHIVLMTILVAAGGSRPVERRHKSSHGGWQCFVTSLSPVPAPAQPPLTDMECRSVDFPFLASYKCREMSAMCLLTCWPSCWLFLVASWWPCNGTGRARILTLTPHYRLQLYSSTWQAFGKLPSTVSKL